MSKIFITVDGARVESEETPRVGCVELVRVGAGEDNGFLRLHNHHPGWGFGAGSKVTADDGAFAALLKDRHGEMRTWFPPDPRACTFLARAKVGRRMSMTSDNLIPWRYLDWADHDQRTREAAQQEADTAAKNASWPDR